MKRPGEHFGTGKQPAFQGAAKALKAVRITAFSVLLAAVLCLLPASFGRAQEARGDKDYVTDMADILSEDEEEELREECGELAGRYSMDFVVVTTEEKNGKTVFDYVYDFYMEKGYGYDEPGGDGFALLIDMEDRNVYILSRGQAPRWVSDQTLTDISDGISGYLGDGDFARGCGLYLSEVAKTLDRLGYEPGAEPETDMTLQRAAAGEKREGQRFPVWSRLLGALLFGAAATGIAVYVTKGTDGNTSGSRSYLKGQARVTDSRDIFVNRTQTRTPRPKQSSGGSSGGDSFGGHFDSNTGGGGSKF